MHIVTFFAVKGNITRRSRTGITGCCAFDRVRGDRDAAQKMPCDSYARSLAATLDCLAGDWIDRAALAACWYDTSATKTSLPVPAINQRRLSNKQSWVICANFERGLFKNAAHPPVDGFISRSQN